MRMGSDLPLQPAPSHADTFASSLLDSLLTYIQPMCCQCSACGWHKSFQQQGVSLGFASDIKAISQEIKKPHKATKEDNTVANGKGFSPGFKDLRSSQVL